MRTQLSELALLVYLSGAAVQLGFILKRMDFIKGELSRSFKERNPAAAAILGDKVDTVTIPFSLTFIVLSWPFGIRAQLPGGKWDKLIKEQSDKDE